MEYLFSYLALAAFGSFFFFGFKNNIEIQRARHKLKQNLTNEGVQEFISSANKRRQVMFYLEGKTQYYNDSRTVYQMVKRSSNISKEMKHDLANTLNKLSVWIKD